jgi:DNA-binding CsgD family transcriptional regulator
MNASAPGQPRQTQRPIPRLRWRPTREADLPQCMALLPAWLGLDDRKPALQALWAELLDDPAITTTVMEDLALPAPQRLLGWGCSVVLPTAHAQALGLLDDPPRPPGPLVAGLYQRWMAGEPRPDLKALAEANGQGQLHLLNLHYAQRPANLADPLALAVLAVANDAFRFAVGGWQLQAMHIEGCAADVPMFTAAGFPVCPYAQSGPWERLPDELRPTHFGITRRAALAMLPGTSVRQAFDHYPPRFRFSPSQRRLLWLALFDDSDEALMARLEVSVHALKKLWRGIYERIEDVAPGFFGDDTDRADDDGKRGPEKRRQVLAYVRQRPEELRPWA